MGYYLNIKSPDLGIYGYCLGGKFYGYYDEDVLKRCDSFKFLSQFIDDPEILFDGWGFEFSLKLNDAVLFLEKYRFDFIKIAGRVPHNIDIAIMLLRDCGYSTVVFMMG